MSEKEHILRNMALLFPSEDTLVLQSVLTKSNWDLEKANDMLTEMSGTTKAKKLNGLSAHLEKFAHSKRKRALSSSDEEDVVQPQRPLAQQQHHNNNSAAKRKKVYVGSDDEVDYLAENDDLDSDDSDVHISDTGKDHILKFVQTSTQAELQAIQGCSRKKAELIVDNRPYSSWRELSNKFDSVKGLKTDLLKNIRELLQTRQVVGQLMNNCHEISQRIGQKVANLSNHQTIVTQPSSLNPSLHLKPYQMVGLNWLALLHEQKINGILADEMGLGKTVQAIAFLAHLRLLNKGPHLIVVPSSTLDNWIRELETWLPTAKLLCYYGSQEQRKDIRCSFNSNNVEELDIMLTTYNIVSSSPEDRHFFKKLHFYYVVFDEGHMLKNMKSQRYQSLIRINSTHKLLLTGTPLQNNLVLQQLPTKKEEVLHVPLSDSQQQYYTELVTKLSAEYNSTDQNHDSHQGSLMKLRKAANHPLLFRRHYTDEAIDVMSKVILKDPNYQQCDQLAVKEDMSYMSDFQLYQLCCKSPEFLGPHRLPPDLLVDSGKMKALDDLLPHIKSRGEKVLVFSQFTMMLDILEVYMDLRDYRWLRLDGSTPVADRKLMDNNLWCDRQDLIDQFSEDEEMFVFLLSTKAGGLGINLTAANNVIIHDIDFNPYNDKQAEDRCHRVGQTK
ncbi:SMARCAD1 [Cordylochernes scorpioides]|uniref:SMARCAD1 n=1 Tax=Cordylochernes scorpioides TaxID=51811 RepID=A0ABY6LD11_9ARAC|nr:SMARCAD1 [Cordylochernes scorpioides]